MSRAPFLLVGLCVAVVAGCSRAPRDPVAALLGDLEAAAEARDVTAIEKRLAAGFLGQDGIPRARALDEARRYFALYEEVRVEVYGIETPESGRVVFHVDFAGHAKPIGGLSSFVPPEAAYRFECELVEEDGSLKLARASWQAVPLQGPPPEATPRVS